MVFKCISGGGNDGLKAKISEKAPKVSVLKGFKLKVNNWLNDKCDKKKIQIHIKGKNDDLRPDISLR